MSNGTAAGNSVMPGPLALLAPAWVGITIFLSFRRAVATYPMLSETGLPQGVSSYVAASLAADAVTVAWGFYLIILASGRSRRFPRHFVIWQTAILAWIAATEIYVLVAPDFVFDPSGLAWTAVEIAVGLALIFLLTRQRGGGRFDLGPGTGRPPLVQSLIVGVLGTIFCAALGFGAGLLAGAAIAEIGEMSCFEGACGFFALFVGLAGLLVGAIAGIVLSVRFARRPRKAA